MFPIFFLTAQRTFSLWSHHIWLIRCLHLAENDREIKQQVASLCSFCVLVAVIPTQLKTSIRHVNGTQNTNKLTKNG